MELTHLPSDAWPTETAKPSGALRLIDSTTNSIREVFRILQGLNLLLQKISRHAIPVRLFVSGTFAMMRLIARSCRYLLLSSPGARHDGAFSFVHVLVG